MVISGMGEFYLEIIVDCLCCEFKVEVSQGVLQVNYKEVLILIVDYCECFKKQFGGFGFFVDMQFEIGLVDQEFLDSEVFKDGKEKL